MTDQIIIEWLIHTWQAKTRRKFRDFLIMDSLTIY